MTLLTTIAAFAVTIGILITFHELGHYLVARLCGVKILRFSLGFGKPIFIYKRKNDPDATEWAVSALPLGGYVRMLDARDPACPPIKPEDKNREFGAKNVWQRFAIVAAGPFANLLLAVLLYASIFMIGSTQPTPVVAEPPAGTPAAMAGLHAGDKILKVGDSDIKTFTDLRMEMLNKFGSTTDILVHSPNGSEVTKEIDLTKMSLDPKAKDADPFDEVGLHLNMGHPFISSFVENSAAQRDGIKIGDHIYRVGNVPVKMPKDFVSEIKKYPGKPVTLLVGDENGPTHTLEVTPVAAMDEQGNEIGRIGAAIGVDFPHTQVSYGLLKSLAEGVKKTWDTAAMSVRMIGKMFTGDVSISNISGPVTIADYAGQTAQLGILPFISFLALVSISLGILNLLPIPMLDGGHLLYYSLEVVTGKPVSEAVQASAQKIGIAALFGLTILALFNDLTRLLP